jgi:hypothetical protein
MNERAGSHGGACWREEFPLMVAWAFGRWRISCVIGGLIQQLVGDTGILLLISARLPKAHLDRR